VLEQMAETKARGGQVTAQVMPRPIGVVIGLELSVHPFILCPSWAKVADLPLEKQVEAMRDPEFRAAILSEEPGQGHPLVMLGRNWRWIFPFDERVDYAPGPERSLEALAAKRGCTPAEVAYDFFLESEGHGLMLNAIGNFENNSLAATREMLSHPDCIPSLGDGGAHYGAICDASYSTFLLKHFVRDNRDGGFGLAEAVHMLTQKAARAVGLQDRGVLAVGMKADINVVDLERLTLHLPEIVHDLPAGGRRLDQKATGYDATIVSGEVIRRMDQATGARPGRLVRGAG
jgi:N-acyl-D-amino-acid deacylase